MKIKHTYEIGDEVVIQAAGNKLESQKFFRMPIYVEVKINLMPDVKRSDLIFHRKEFELEVTSNERNY